PLGPVPWAHGPDPARVALAREGAPPPAGSALRSAGLGRRAARPGVHGGAAGRAPGLAPVAQAGPPVALHVADDDRLERLLLTDEPTLRALAAWVSLPRASRAAKGLTQWSDSGLWYSEVEWAVAAGLQLPDLRTIRTRLLSMGI